MKKMRPCLFVCAAFFCWIPKMQAQDSAKSDETEKSHFEAGLSYLSNNIYLGRQDSLRVPYLTPTFSYYHKSGIYFSSSLSYLNSEGVSRIDLFDIDAGYSFTASNLSGDFYVEKDFYNSQSQNVKAETKGSVNGTLSYDLGFIKPVMQGGIELNKVNDYYAALGVSHTFSLLNDQLEIDPSFLVNASTQNAYNSYYHKRKFATKRKQTGAFTSIQAYLQNASDFKIMDYEFSLPTDYTAGKFTFDFTPTAAVPVNPNVVVETVTPPSGISETKTKTEKITNTFFWSIGVTYNFGLKKIKNN
ncbi:MAG: hypothetical protein JSS98_01915 [Bacteroidetes bacterium]|nr:hypothetical protein [Bacteroidota bacterium]